MSMKVADSLYGSNARLNSKRYINTTDLCLEMFYWLESDANKDQPVINVILVSEERVETTVFSTIYLGKVLTGWNRLYQPLPDGIFQIVIEGVRSYLGQSGLSIDDILVQQCSAFGKSK